MHAILGHRMIFLFVFSHQYTICSHLGHMGSDNLQLATCNCQAQNFGSSESGNLILRRFYFERTTLFWGYRDDSSLLTNLFWWDDLFLKLDIEDDDVIFKCLWYPGGISKGTPRLPRKITCRWFIFWLHAGAESSCLKKNNQKCLRHGPLGPTSINSCQNSSRRVRCRTSTGRGRGNNWLAKDGYD